MHDVMSGGYEEGYERCSCFWGTEPGSFLKLMTHYETSFTGRRALDAGCGEGKNAVFLARLGANVDAVDVSPVAIENGRRVWKQEEKVRWIVADIRYLKLPQKYDVVIAYGLLHCLTDRTEVMATISALQAANRAWRIQYPMCVQQSPSTAQRSASRFSSMSARPSRVPVSL